jgi:ribosomal protein S18 acetylase RimI-like enzyme
MKIDDSLISKPLYDSQCLKCKHLVDGPAGARCKAYPNSIDVKFILNETIHDKVIPGQEGDFIFSPKNFTKGISLFGKFINLFKGIQENLFTGQTDEHGNQLLPSKKNPLVRRYQKQQEARGEKQEVKKYYNSHGKPYSFKEFVETEVEERGNYRKEFVDEIAKKYNISGDDKVIWVTPDKHIAHSYNLNADERDNVHDIPEDELSVYEYSDKDGFIIPETDDEDDGYLMVLRKKEEEFGSIDEANDWIDAKSKEYGNKNKFLASDEYKKVYPKIQELHKQGKSKYQEKAKQALEEKKQKEGDEVEYSAASPFGDVFVYEGKIVLKDGIPYVNLNKKTVDGKKQVKWHKGFTKIQNNQYDIKDRQKVQADILKQAGIPEEEIPDYVLDSVADGKILGKRAEAVIDGDIKLEEAAEKVKQDYEKMKSGNKDTKFLEQEGKKNNSSDISGMGKNDKLKTPFEIARKPLYIDQYGKPIVYDKNGYQIAVNDLDNATYITLWNNGKRVGHLTTADKAIGVKDYTQIGMVEIDKKHQKQGLAKELYKQLLKHLPNDKKGVAGYYTDIVAKKPIKSIYMKLGGYEKEDGNYYIDKEQLAKGLKVFGK